MHDIVLSALIALCAVLLGLVTFVQLLYLESLRLRTRDLPAIKFFRETLEDKIGLETEDGAGSFSLVKHSAIVLLAILYFLLIRRRHGLDMAHGLGNRFGRMADDDHRWPTCFRRSSTAALRRIGWRRSRQ